MPNIIDIALRPEVFKTAIKVSLIIGTVLALINHGPALLSLSLSTQNVVQIILTYLVPYGVSSYSAIQIILDKE